MTVMTPSRVLACIDGSPPAFQAARLAITLAKGWGATIRAICVIDDSDLALMEPVLEQRANLEQRLRRAAESSLLQVEQLGRESGVSVEPVLTNGIPFEKILEEARRLQPDLIFMGRTGRRGPGRVLLGSETERVLEFTGWPVVVVPAKGAA